MKKQVHNLIILDESGSMSSIKNSVITGFNEIVETMQIAANENPDQDHFISLVSFNGANHTTHHWKDEVKLLKKLNTKNYNPGASTPLLDSMGFSLTRLENEVRDLNDFHVLVTIFTDGEENASREYDYKTIKTLVDSLKAGPWTFTYIGTEHDVESIATRISIKNVIKFDKSAAGVADIMTTERTSRMLFMEKLKHSNMSQEDYYDHVMGTKKKSTEGSGSSAKGGQS